MLLTKLPTHPAIGPERWVTWVEPVPDACLVLVLLDCHHVWAIPEIGDKKDQRFLRPKVGDRLNCLDCDMDARSSPPSAMRHYARRPAPLVDAIYIALKESTAADFSGLK